MKYNDWTLLELSFPKVKFWKPELSNVSLDASIGDDSIIHAGVHIHDGAVIGKRCKIQAGVKIFNGVTLEDDVFIGPDVVFTNDKHPPSEEIILTLVKKGTSIGANSTIICGVTIGENALIGAGSIVTKDIPAGEIWFGNPAHYYGKR